MITINKNTEINKYEETSHHNGLAQGSVARSSDCLLYTSLGKQRFGLLLEALYTNNRITDSVAEKAKAQYTQLCSEAHSTLHLQFKVFLDGDCSSKRLDDFFFLLYYLGINVIQNCGKLLN